MRDGQHSMYERDMTHRERGRGTESMRQSKRKSEVERERKREIERKRGRERERAGQRV